MNQFNKLIEILEKSVKKNGEDTKLTIGHLLNICKKVSRDVEEESYYDDVLSSVPDKFCN
jgi:hypothetical protein